MMVDSSHELLVDRWRDGVQERVIDRVAEEVPVALVFHGVSHAVMLATPADLEDLAAGFTLSEGIVAGPEEIHSLESMQHEDGSFAVNIGIASTRFSDLLRRERNTTGRTGCGLCGAAKVDDAIRPPSSVPSGVRVSVTELHAALINIRAFQQVNAMTGSVHAAAWVTRENGIELVREDVGRHNALDKVIGALIRKREDISRGWFLITSRASYEMVQKSTTVGVSFLAAVSAPTAFAVRLAQSTGLTLVGFARDRQHVVYANPQRLTEFKRVGELNHA